MSCGILVGLKFHYITLHISDLYFLPSTFAWNKVKNKKEPNFFPSIIHYFLLLLLLLNLSSLSGACHKFGAMGLATVEAQFHVLAVDDSLIDRKLIEMLLKKTSYQGTEFFSMGWFCFLKKDCFFILHYFGCLFVCGSYYSWFW